MLVLSRKLDEKIMIGPDIVITVIRIEGNQVRLGIDAPKDVQITRDNAHAKEPRPARKGLARRP